MSAEQTGTELTRWTIHNERLVDDTRKMRVSIAQVELPDGVTFEQWVLRTPKAAMMAIVDDQNRVLMMWRHRFIIDKWAWELPGGWVDPNDPDPEATAVREVEEETGWRPKSVQRIGSFQPMVGTADAENVIFLGMGAEYVGTPQDINEAERIAWIELGTVRNRIAKGEIVGAASQIALLHLLAFDVR
ncbi:NUDIX hydrolase [Actinocrispum wychmicini]|uniref:NUDIX hydrolase n=1 Tax=Actinocrispum wychmicini TaxID=1213861 RepID=UPI001A9F460C|nr:NUDIX hydrolase [Actinocrispum wychmicini]